MTFSANQRPRDTSGFLVEPGDYRVSRDGQVRLATVFESGECDLWVRFRGEEQPQRVDETSQFCCWAKAEQSELADDATA